MKYPKIGIVVGADGIVPREVTMVSEKKVWYTCPSISDTPWVISIQSWRNWVNGLRRNSELLISNGSLQDLGVRL